MQLTRWVDAAVKQETYAHSPFTRYGKFLGTALKTHRKKWKLAATDGAYYKTPERLALPQRASLVEKLMFKDTHLSFVLLWVLLEPSSVTRMTGKFEEWSFPCIEAELDHQGLFRVLPTGEIFYKGGETKGSYTGMSTFSVTSINFTSSQRCQVAIAVMVPYD